ncbi:HU family DNA-binding protein [Meiothermus hypogaeus]|uniref:DNA-binding protein HU-beta n=2 Tax=Meiothermus hypogaeus TaxID=884155 RepID=A0A511QZA3_9DEIN|nr:HU family DNA-binding protein [Meiothermus hypogaeus]RIH79216.1 DNA-binding protein HU [Meiothermus hypogaeus]GEM81862.1 DNA-binding protein HU-beta [Meiothermus hypogaeus NBRC 106114]
MNKTQIVEHIQTQTGLSKKQAHLALEATLLAIKTNLSEGREVQISGFGTFYTRARAARAGTHPGSGEAIQIPAQTVARFRPGKSLREAVS